MNTPKSRIDYEHFQTIPRYDNRRFELIDGRVFIPPTPNTAHQRTVGNVLFALDKFVNQRDVGEVFLGPLDVVFGKWTALEPDLLFVGNDRASIVTEDNLQGGPDLVVEVLSRGNETYDRETKMRVYESAGVPELWHLDPEEKTAEILNFGADGRYAVTATLSGDAPIVSKILPGLSLTLKEVFADAFNPCSALVASGRDNQLARPSRVLEWSRRGHPPW
jgi:Uma2 family endonuclease